MAANYHGRRAPNVSQYVANLNTIPSAADMAAQQQFGNFDDDLALFTNTHFFDLDMGEPVPDMPSTMAFDGSRQGPGAGQDGTKGMDFVNQPTFPTYQEFGPFPQAALNRSPVHSLPPSPPNGLPFAAQPQQSRPTLPSAAHFSTVPQSLLASGPQPGEKRTSAAASLPSGQELEEVSRVAAEEDKRRRNTAASARFRVKKKQREQALEKTAKEMSDKVQVLEARVGQLEMENQWLKGLITERSGGKGDKVEMPEAMRESARKIAEDGERVKRAEEAKKIRDAELEADDEEEVEEERSREDKKRGVGTESLVAKA